MKNVKSTQELSITTTDMSTQSWTSVKEMLKDKYAVLILEDPSTAGLSEALRKIGVWTYSIAYMDSSMTDQEGGEFDLDIAPHDECDCIVGGCTCFSSKGATFVRSARTAKFVYFLKRKGFFRKDFAKIAIADPARRRELGGSQRRFVFMADTVLDAGTGKPLPLRKKTRATDIPDGLFGELLRSFPADRLNEIRGKLCECRGSAGMIVKEIVGESIPSVIIKTDIVQQEEQHQ